MEHYAELVKDDASSEMRIFFFLTCFFADLSFVRT